MKFLLTACLAWLTCSSLAARAVQLRSPQELLSRAAQNRIELRQVIFDLKKNLSEFVDLEQLTSYAALVEDLQPFAVELKLDEIYPNALEDLGAGFFAQAIKWLDPRSVPENIILFYFQWATFDYAFRFSELVEFLINQPFDPSKRYQILKTVQQLQIASQNQFSAQPQLAMSFQRIVSDRAARALIEEGAASEQSWLSMIQTASGFSILIDWLQAQVLDFDQDEPIDLASHLKLALNISQQINNSHFSLPEYLRASINLVKIDILMASLEFEVPLAEELLSETIDGLNSAELRGLGQNLSAREKIPSQNYFETFFLIYNLTLKHLHEARLFETERWLNLQLQRLAAPRMLSSQQGEGHYQLFEPGENKPTWLFTLIKATDDRVYATLASQSGQVFKSFFYIGFDTRLKQFLASEREPDIDSRPNPSIRFFWDEQQRLQVIDQFGAQGFLHLSGNKVQEFSIYKPIENPPQFVPTRFEGTIEFLSGEKRSVALVIHQVNQQLLGRLTIMNARGQAQNFIEYQFGKLVSDQLVSLTSGLLLSRNLNHLRGRLEANQFRGVLIVGGRGQTTKEFTLTAK